MNTRIKRVTGLLVSLAMLCSFCFTAFADPTYLSTVETVAEGFVIYDATTGEVILGKEEDTNFYPASITKIMTALLVCENIDDLDQEITFGSAALNEMTSDSSTLTPEAQVGEKMTVRDMLYGMFLVSANECAAQLGITVAGSTEAFAEMMNERAEEIGCTNTHFVNAHGLHDEDHYTTPSDMALIMAEALKNQVFLQMVTTYEYTIEATNMCDEDRELTCSHSIVNGTIPYAEVYAGKTGRTPEAGRTLVTAARFDGHDVIIVIMKSDEDEFYNDTLKLLEYARGYLSGEYTDMTWTEKKETVYVYQTNALKVRDYPSSAGTKVLGSLQYGQSVTRVATWGEWSMIEYLSEYYYVHSDYLTTEEPEDEYDPSTALKETTREDVEISVSLDSDEETEEEDTEEGLDIVVDADSTDGDSSTTTAVATLDETDEEHTRLEGVSVDDGSDSLHEGSRNSIVRTVMIVCIVLMVIIAAAFIYTVVMERKRKKRRRHHINTDEWYK